MDLFLLLTSKLAKFHQNRGWVGKKVYQLAWNYPTTTTAAAAAAAAATTTTTATVNSLSCFVLVYLKVCRFELSMMVSVCL